MLVIIINHLAWGPSFYSMITGEGSLLASAAEGFFAISGILVGYIYGPRILNNTRAVCKKLFTRALTLWALAVFFTLFYTAWALLHPDSAKFNTVYALGVEKFLTNTLSLRYAFGWTDFLTRYAVFMLAAPLALWLIAKGRAWIVAIASIAVWALLRKTEMFLPFSAWQIVFFMGIIVGFYLPVIEKTVLGWSKKVRRISYATLVTSFLITYLISVFALIGLPFLLKRMPDLIEISVVSHVHNFFTAIMPYFDKSTLDPARIIVGTLWLSGLYVLFRRYEQPIDDATRGVVTLIGRNSLFVYCLHAFILFAIDLYFLPPDDYSLTLNTLVATAVLVLIYFITKHRAIFTRARYALLPSTKPETDTLKR